MPSRSISRPLSRSVARKVNQRSRRGSSVPSDVEAGFAFRTPVVREDSRTLIDQSGRLGTVRDMLPGQANVFENDLSQHLDVTGLAGISYPFTLSVFMRAVGGATDTVLWVGDSTSTNEYYALRIGATSAILTARDGSFADINGSTNVKDDEWHHLAGVFRSATDRELFVDGASEGTDTTSVNLLPIDSLVVGADGDASPTGFLDGYAFEGTLYTRDLSGSEILSIASLLDDPTNFSDPRDPLIQLDVYGRNAGSGGSDYDAVPVGGTIADLLHEGSDVPFQRKNHDGYSDGPSGITVPLKANDPTQDIDGNTPDYTGKAPARLIADADLNPNTLIIPNGTTLTNPDVNSPEYRDLNTTPIVVGSPLPPNVSATSVTGGITEIVINQ